MKNLLTLITLTIAIATFVQGNCQCRTFCSSGICNGASNPGCSCAGVSQTEAIMFYAFMPDKDSICLADGYRCYGILGPRCCNGGACVSGRCSETHSSESEHVSVKTTAKSHTGTNHANGTPCVAAFARCSGESVCCKGLECASPSIGVCLPSSL